MSIPKQDRQATFLDTGFLAQDLFDANDRYEIFRREMLPALQDIRGLSCELYCQDNGRPGIEPVLMAGITLLQFMENVPDRKALENVRLHLGWKHALDLKIDYRGFHPTSLVTFRQRLTEHENGRLIFDGILQALHQQGLVKRRGKLFTAENFDVSVAKRQAVCPAGHTSTQCSRLENQKTGQVDYRFEWSTHCDDCPLQSQCTTAKNGRRMLVVGEHHDHLQQRRRTRYRGLDKTSLCNYLHGAAINAKRWIRLLQYRMAEAAATIQ